MALETGIIEFPFTQGQNEGTDRAVLPVPQLSYLQNARMRKGQRLGKRNGYTSVSSLDADGDPLGNGNGRLSCLGPSFCVVDDRFYMRDEAGAGAWRLPPQPFDNGAVAGTRLAGRFPQFMPGPARETLTVQSDPDLGAYTGTAEGSVGGITYALGYVWTCCAWFSEQASNWLVRVCASDPETGRTVWQKDIDPITTTPPTVRMDVVLLSTGNGSVVLIYDHFTAGVKDGVRVRTLTTLAGGFSAEVSFACLESAANYDPYDATSILFIYTTAATEYTVARMNPATMVAIDSGTNTSPVASPTLLSVFGISTGEVWVGFTDGANLRCHAWDAGLVIAGTGIVWNGGGGYSGAVGPIMFAQRSATTVCGVVKDVPTGGAINPPGLSVLDADTTAVVSGRMRQFNVEALSQPFALDGQVFIWVRHYADAQLGVATLCRIPGAEVGDEYANNAVSPYVRSWPIEATLDDRDVDSPLDPAAAGAVVPKPVATSAGTMALISYTRASIVMSATPTLLQGFVVVPVRHRSEGVRYSPSGVISCAGKYFVPGAQPMFVDSLLEYEGGFVQAPVMFAVTSGAGSLTANSKYYYSAIYESVDSNGLIERSAPSLPFEADTSAGATEWTLAISVLSLGMRTVRAKIYRQKTGGVPQLITSVDASPASNVNRYVEFVDNYADSFVDQNETLYTAIGQELAAAQYPACSFAVVGNNRLWCAGGFNSRVIHASKQFVPRIGPEFADDDAFRPTLPADCTGLAWCDNLVAFTRDNIYFVAGDGPDAAGVGAFAPAQPLPYNVGCIDWRSVVTTDLGVFFQSSRGLHLLPRGFGAPVIMDQVEDTLASYPIITSARVFYSSASGEQVVRWTATATEGATSGVVITYDLTFRTWQVDTYTADGPACFQTEWEGEPVLAPASTLIGAGGASRWHPFRVQDTGFDDNGLAIEMQLQTGDVRPWGLFAHGVINRIGLFGAAKTAATVNVSTTTEHGTRTAPKAYLGAGEIALDVALGKDTLRDANFLRVAISESSTVEGVTLTGLVIEHDKKNQGFRLLQAADRIT